MNKYNTKKILVAVGLILVAASASFFSTSKSQKIATTSAENVELLAKSKLQKDRNFANKAEGLNYLMSHDKVKFKKVNIDSREMRLMLSDNEIINVKTRKQNPMYSMFEFTKEGSKDIYRYSFLMDKDTQSCVLRAQVVYAGALDTTLIKDMNPLALNPSICAKYSK